MSTEDVANQTPTEQIPAIQAGVLALRFKDEEIEALDSMAAECASLATTNVSPFRRTFLMAAGMRQLQQMISDEMMQDIMELQGSPLGFETDKDKPEKDGQIGYPMDVVKNALIEATLRGLRPVGGEWFILSAKCYARKPGLKRLVMEWPGLTDLQVQLHVPRKAEGYTVVPAKASWKLNGVKQELDCTSERSIPVRVNEGQIVDAIHGKAYRKIYARIYDILTGAEQGLVEPDGDATESQSAVTTTYDDREQQLCVAEYAQRIGQLTEMRPVSAEAQKAGKDERLSKESRQRITDLCTERISQIRNSRGERAIPLRPVPNSTTQAH
jgi:hypothetical protein